ncbi:hypothetical protein SAMN02910276_01006 [Butyrivibrio sp. Su6]|uniref:hypothetical protein n=1 Tax=Butyrivibrio sp. Su6 TaxID=1520810 RepID=UPI00089F1415|nr:hypothetical protein [Butyrivibrio sp. Su6]SEF76849.1 hypothetical protein SAMN02910276_01006 [Butyrivibrio sp. Su6]
MKLSRLFAVALSGLLFIQAPVVAFAEEDVYQDGKLYQCDDKGSDYLFVGKNGFFLSDTEHENKETPYPIDGDNTAFTQVTDNSANGKEYGAGHAFDCAQSPESGYVGGLKDPYITGHSEPLTDGQVLKLSYLGEDTKNYRLSLITASSGSESSEKSGSEGEQTNPQEGSSEQGQTTEPATEPASEPTVEPAQPETPAEQSSNTEQATNTSDDSQNQQSTQEPQAPDTTGKINVVNTAVGNALPTTELGNAQAPTKTVSIDVFSVSPAQFSSAVIDTVANAPTSGEVVIETNTIACLDKNMVDSMSKRTDVAISIIFKNKDGQKLKVTIPAGYNVTTLLDSNGYCGYMHLVDVFGATVLTE